MGKIRKARVNNNGSITCEVDIQPDENTHLQGNYEGVYIFSDRLLERHPQVSSRGNNHSTKYFLIPIKKRIGVDFSNVSFQRFDIDDKAFFIYAAAKIQGSKYVNFKPKYKSQLPAASYPYEARASHV